MAPHKKHNGLIPAVVYYRMSSDKHEASILEQCEAVERHAKYVTFQLAEVAVPRRLFAAILDRIARLAIPPPGVAATRG